MDWKDALLEIVTQPGSRLRFAEPLAKHTYFGIGGEATAYIEISTVSELQHWHISTGSGMSRLPLLVAGLTYW